MKYLLHIYAEGLEFNSNRPSKSSAGEEERKGGDRSASLRLVNKSQKAKAESF